ncbi:hypothetical protein CYLTODRAFT_424473 [Cylindrobasidium torrendii FP15055 ss-10]|uniref:B box-type domain-containing protein n=1 Tax=Cylindrobasidium torrendii FP15055 ss-10 TaxID=1314674 RepID=A0A0D7B6Y5_9AGAR|nr:hypothetical protein CYLTODRAFT_424473 [Cylindrobasidium torrendii FP15055 ss-10]
MTYKRRRISSNSLSRTSSAMAMSIENLAAQKPSASSACVSCQRSLNTRTWCPVICSRCGNSTCVVCSRRCTGVGIDGPPVQTPGRAALSLHSQNAKGTGTGTLSKRKKVESEITEDEKTKDSADEWEAGCGRIMCRNCCVENIHDDTTACLDCINHTSHTS